MTTRFGYQVLAWKGKYVRDTIVHYIEHRTESVTLCGKSTDGWMRMDYEPFWKMYSNVRICRHCYKLLSLSYRTKTARRIKEMEQVEDETENNV